METWGNRGHSGIDFFQFSHGFEDLPEPFLNPINTPVILWSKAPNFELEVPAVQNTSEHLQQPYLSQLCTSSYGIGTKIFVLKSSFQICKPRINRSSDEGVTKQTTGRCRQERTERIREPICFSKATISIRRSNSLRFKGLASVMSEAPSSPGGGSVESGGDQSPKSNIREQDRFLPIANISRIMKKALPANGKIAKDAKEVVQECVSEFISFITSEASDKCQKEKRKTINGDDLLWAMATLGFEDYIEPLKVYLTRYRELEGDTKGSAKGEGSGRKDTVGSGGQFVPNHQLAHQGSFNQAVNYGNLQDVMVPMHGPE